MFVEQELIQEEMQAVDKLKNAYKTLKQEIKKVIVGQEEVVDQVLICIFARGHSLLIGVPGLAKTLLISTLAQSLSLSFSTIQFTPDLMPADITGTEVIQEDRETHERSFKFLPGPIFANVILADEINRTSPKTQAALLEGMQEYQVTAAGKKHVLPQPFFVLATQNPIEQEGTYPLPEAQLDRFMFNILVDYPSQEEEFEIMKMTTTNQNTTPTPSLSAEEILEIQRIVRQVPIGDSTINYALQFSRLTRVNDPLVPDFIKKYVSWGAGPRAGQYLILGAKANAILHGRYMATSDDIRAVVHPVLRHRIITNYTAHAEGIDSDHIIDRLIDYIPLNPMDSIYSSQIAKVLNYD